MSMKKIWISGEINKINSSFRCTLLAFTLNKAQQKTIYFFLRCQVKNGVVRYTAETHRPLSTGCYIQIMHILVQLALCSWVSVLFSQGEHTEGHWMIFRIPILHLSTNYGIILLKIKFHNACHTIMSLEFVTTLHWEQNLTFAVTKAIGISCVNDCSRRLIFLREIISKQNRVSSW